MVPKPIQRPHPPIRLAANSADTFTFAGANRYPIFAGGPVNPIPVLAERLKIYEDALKGAATQAARRLAGRRADGVCRTRSRSSAGDDRAEPAQLLQRGQRNHRARKPCRRRSRRNSRKSATACARSTTRPSIRSWAIFGDPEYCIDRIAQLKEQFGFSRLVCWFEIGGHQRPSERARRDAPVRGSRDAEISVKTP